MTAGLHVCGCEANVPTATEGDRNVRESVQTFVIQSQFVVDIAFVVEPEQRERARPLVRELLRELITGDADNDGTVDHHASSQVRVTFLTSDQLSAFAEPHPGAPGYVFAPCVAAGSCEPPESSATYVWQPYGYAPSVASYLDAVDCLLADSDTTCESAPDGLSPMFATTVKPVTLTDLEAPRVALVTELQHCVLQLDLAANSNLNDVAFDDDGLVRCTVTETLPSTGPITRCEQLTDAGRTLLRVDDAGREVCSLAQVGTNADGSPGTGRGFYFYDGDMPPHDGAFTRPTASPDRPTTCGVYFSPGRYLLQTPATPFVWGSEITERCTLATSEQP